MGEQQQQQQGEDELPVVVDNNSPSTCDVPMGGSYHSNTATTTNQQQLLSQSKQSQLPTLSPSQTRAKRDVQLPIIHDLGRVDDFDDDNDNDEKDLTKRSTNCYITNARTLCTIFTLLFIFLTCIGIGFAIFPTTRYLSLVVFLPLVVVSFLSCVTAICIISFFEVDDDDDDDDDDEKDAKEKRLVVIEPTDLPAPTPKKKNHRVHRDNDIDNNTNNNNNNNNNNNEEEDEECCIEGGGNNTVASTVSESMEENNNNEANLLESTLPEVHEFIQSTQKSFDEATNYVISKIVRPAATFCRPTSTNTNISTGTNTSTGGGLGLTRRRSTDGALNTSISRNNSRNSNHTNNNNNSNNRISTSTSTIKASSNPCPDDIEYLRDENGIINLSGTYKLIHNDNFDLFLKALNIPSLFRRAACLARPVHTYTHDTQTNSFRVQIDGIIKGDSLFEIYGTPSLSYIRNYTFLDHVSYNDDKSGVVVRKEFQDTGKKSSANMAGSVLFVERTLCQGGKKLTLTSTAVQADGSVVAVSKQTFLRI